MTFFPGLITSTVTSLVPAVVVAYFYTNRQVDPTTEKASGNNKEANERKKEIAKRLGRPLIKTNTYEDIIACDVINPDHIDVGFSSIGGLEKIKQHLHELVILPLRRPELFNHGNLLGPQKGVLLHGPPGTGKTTLAKAIAKESGAVFINVKMSTLMGMWFGEAQKLVCAVFSLAHKLQPAIIFIDEVDSFLAARQTSEHSALTSMKTEFMALWDGISTDKHARVMVLAATNRRSVLDEAILRRFTHTFRVGLPNTKDRSKILKVVLKDERVDNNIDYDRLAVLADGYSGSDLTDLCKKAAYFPLREYIKLEEKGEIIPETPRPLSQKDLESILATSNPCITTNQLPNPGPVKSCIMALESILATSNPCITTNQLPNPGPVKPWHLLQAWSLFVYLSLAALAFLSFVSFCL